MLLDPCRRMRTLAVADARGNAKNLVNIDQEATLGIPKSLDFDDIIHLKAFQNGGAWCTDDLHRLGRADDSICGLCGYGPEGKDQVAWFCKHPAVIESRANAHTLFVGIDPCILPFAVRQGVAPAMPPLRDATYWGEKRISLSDAHAKIRVVCNVTFLPSQALDIVEEHRQNFGDSLDGQTSMISAGRILNAHKMPMLGDGFELPGFISEKPLWTSILGRTGRSLTPSHNTGHLVGLVSGGPKILIPTVMCPRLRTSISP